jgi:hypothetical protein
MIRHALRTIGRMPGLAAVVILSLGIGIGVNTTVFSWIQAVMLKPIPGVDDSGSFYHLDPKSDTGTYPGMSWAEYQDLKPRLQSIEELVVFRMAPLNVGEAGRTERTYAQLVSGNLFGALHLQPVAGRFITRATRHVRAASRWWCYRMTTGRRISPARHRRSARPFASTTSS